MRGYFAVGVERSSKQLNLGNLMRSSHAFGASFFFTIGATFKAVEGISDTSKSLAHMPFYNWQSIDDAQFPVGCRLIGVELTDDAVDLPSFRHPLNAAYILGPERGNLSDAVLDRCQYVVKIPTKFCINVAMAGAVLMYDRVLSVGRFAPRPVHEGGPREDWRAPGSHGRSIKRR